MRDNAAEKQQAKARQRKALLGFLLVSVVMYVSIMYKIIHYGP